MIRREIKFRAWNGKNMLSWDWINDMSMVQQVICNYGNTYKVMQYTEINDKNGKEIYDGDKIQNKSGRICQVNWHKYSGGWDATPIGKTTGNDALGFEPCQWSYMVEIIGNVWEK